MVSARNLGLASMTPVVQPRTSRRLRFTFTRRQVSSRNSCPAQVAFDVAALPCGSTESRDVAANQQAPASSCPTAVWRDVSCGWNPCQVATPDLRAICHGRCRLPSCHTGVGSHQHQPQSLQGCRAAAPAIISHGRYRATWASRRPRPRCRPRFPPLAATSCGWHAPCASACSTLQGMPVKHAALLTTILVNTMQQKGRPAQRRLTRCQCSRAGAVARRHADTLLIY